MLTSIWWLGGKMTRALCTVAHVTSLRIWKKNEEKMAELFENSRDTELKNDALKIVEHFIGDRPECDRVTSRYLYVQIQVAISYVVFPAP